MPRHLRRRHRRGQRDQQDQPLGDDVDDPRGERLDRVGLADVAQRQRDAERRSPSGSHHPDHHDQQPVHRLLQRRARVAEGARGRGQLGGVAVGADRGRLEVALALDREGAGEDLVADPPHHRLGLAGQLRLVERQPVGAHQVTVGGDLVAAARSAPGRRPRPRSTGTWRGAPSRTTVAFATTSAASLSSVRLARTSWKVPIATLATRMPRKSASLGLPKMIVASAEAGEDRVEDREGVGDRDREVGAAGRLLARRARLAQAARRLGLAQSGDGG